MFVDHLTLADFRSYPSADFALEPGATTFVGANGQGKTNLVEAIDYLASLGSHRVSSDIPLVRHTAEKALVRARVRAGLDDDRAVLLEVEINPGRANRARLNRSPVQRPRELLGILRTVVFSPEDLAIVKGDPGERRRFIDQLLITRWPRMAAVKADYDKVLKQRSALLKSLAGRSQSAQGDAEHTLAVWNDQLARFGAELLQARLRTLAELAPYAAEAYAAIAPRNNLAKITYAPAMPLPAGDDRDELAAALIEQMEQRREEELRRGLTLVGPHRDEITLELGDLPARGYASHGESWSFALSLRLGGFDLLRADGLQPVLILDDVFAELDATRRERLAGHVAEAEQVLITAAVAGDVPGQLAGARFIVEDGNITSEEQP
ncbi:DNA replication/repair protein RecF [Naumannella halotolerans]|uniref:DNA replication/repair protein RecF n=1 Tax=Naumannella halotolerans TaxID=993414 RepID=UPI00370D2888